MIVNTKGLPKGQHGIKIVALSEEDILGYTEYTTPKIIWINVK
jgi:hypothetical protein